MPTASPPTVTTEALGRTARSRSWLWPALALVVVLATAVVLGRSGESALPPTNHVALALPTSSITPPLTLAQPPATPQLGAVQVDPLVQPDARNPPPGAPIVISPLSGRPFVAERWNGQRFVDGIPTSIDHVQVVRVGSALLADVGSSVLVGGWYDGAGCTPEGTGCGKATISDDPAATPRSATMSVAGQPAMLVGAGARILRATVEAGSRLLVTSIAWSGDQETSASPIATVALVHGLAVQFPALDFRAFLEETTCPVNWPDQTYMTSSATVPRADAAALGVRMVILFPTTADRRAREQQLRRSSESLTSFEATARCVSLPGGVIDGDWYAFDNVMLLLAGGDPNAVARARAALIDALAVARISSGS